MSEKSKNVLENYHFEGVKQSFHNVLKSSFAVIFRANNANTKNSLVGFKLYFNGFKIFEFSELMYFQSKFWSLDDIFSISIFELFEIGIKFESNQCFIEGVEIDLLD